MPSVLLPWVNNLPMMQQSVLMAAIRAPDGLRKDHPVKVIMRWYRRCVLYGAFEQLEFITPFEKGGGSFTGPFAFEHAVDMGLVDPGDHMAWESEDDQWETFDKTREVYLRCVDEMPHHFQLHLMHAAEIIGYHHPDLVKQKWWRQFYYTVVNDMHLFPEDQTAMDKRLGDNETHWHDREEVTAL